MPSIPPEPDSLPAADVALSDQGWADLLSPTRRRLLVTTGLAGAAASATLAAPGASAATTGPANGLFNRGGVLAPIKAPQPGQSPWGYATASQATGQPPGVRPGERTLPQAPRAYTAIQSYHAHIYFDEDSYPKAALLRRWVAERFPVELGDWNLEPRGPHVTPSFYFGFTNELLPIVLPWLQLNSLGLTILLHPNTGDGRADHLYYALWVNRSQPVNAYNWNTSADEAIERIYPNIVPSVPLEV
ncbi:DOPA 4,5-dioxygenase family protein [Stenotrophomonas sp. 24(2023)]|uniref:DOPA 4,5-dioxygenase family protein n=1 Tax=Stenotrophomonas sp. 24(2023) TaxID=3068324 RepID=UPI0027DEDBE2|nr:DOPA 4,5-dioxygenase family protein [Stenotrophomonas sp. 24(2023)]WMJ68393.1 DOPA 4,5-dioxygenase family protein [Stenotrophomonas sp. 24(2023)]